MDVAIERMTGISFLVIALSHILRPKEWSEWFRQLGEKGAPGAFVNGLMSLSFGALIVGFHGTQWSGLPAIVTFIGWAQVFKGLLHTCFPAYGLWKIRSVPVEQSWKFVAAGLIMLPASLVILSASLRG